MHLHFCLVPSDSSAELFCSFFIALKEVKVHPKPTPKGSENGLWRIQGGLASTWGDLQKHDTVTELAGAKLVDVCRLGAFWMDSRDGFDNKSVTLKTHMWFLGNIELGPAVAAVGFNISLYNTYITHALASAKYAELLCIFSTRASQYHASEARNELRRMWVVSIFVETFALSWVERRRIVSFDGCLSFELFFADRKSRETIGAFCCTLQMLGLPQADFVPAVFPFPEPIPHEVPQRWGKTELLTQGLHGGNISMSTLRVDPIIHI